jgi:hypothetical protein
VRKENMHLKTTNMVFKCYFYDFSVIITVLMVFNIFWTTSIIFGYLDILWIMWIYIFFLGYNLNYC